MKKENFTQIDIDTIEMRLKIVIYVFELLVKHATEQKYHKDYIKELDHLLDHWRGDLETSNFENYEDGKGFGFLLESVSKFITGALTWEQLTAEINKQVLF